jgi:GH35 family endo-1,4-beta-xylanase
VLDESGKPVAGAEVTLRQKRHEFLFGCNIFLHGRVGSPADEEAYRSRFAAIFNYATLPFYWGAYEPERGQPGHAYRERVAKWCAENGIRTKGHPLVWNHPASVPRWLPADAREVRALSDARVADCVSRFKGLIDIWDVVNESTDPGRFKDGNRMTDAYEALGTVDFTTGSFLVARKANPETTLLINDYRTDDAYDKLISRLARDGRRLYDAIGVQSHMHDGAWSPAHAWNVCEKFARFGVPIHFTETTLVSGRRLGPGENWGPTEPELEEKQAREAVAFYTTLFSHPAVEAITWWDFADRGAWQRAAAGLLRRDLSPKPMYDRLVDLIKKTWWTDVTLKAGEKGEAEARAFYGDYEVQVRHGDQQSTATLRHQRKAGRSELEIRLGS